MRTRSLWFCAIAPAAAQFGLSLPPALQSIESVFQSLADPRQHGPPTIAPAPAPIVRTTRTPQAPPETTVAPPVRTTFVPPSTLVTSSSSHAPQTTQRHGHTPLIHSASTTLHGTSKLAEGAATASPTETATSDSSGGLSHGAKVGIGVSIGVLVLLGLLAGALYSFLRDRRMSEAYSSWRENRRNKHERLGSSDENTSFRGPTLPASTSREKQTEFSPTLEYGNGTVFGKPVALGREKSVHDPEFDRARILGPLAVVNPSTPDAEKENQMESSRTLDEELPPPPMVYQQARQVYIKRKAVPGQAPREMAPVAQYPPRLTGHQRPKPRFSWVEYEWG